MGRLAKLVDMLTPLFGVIAAHITVTTGAKLFLEFVWLGDPDRQEVHLP